MPVELFAVNVEGFTGRFAEELALSPDQPQDIMYRTIEKTIDRYETLRRAEAEGDVTATLYLDAIDHAINHAKLTKKQKTLLPLMLEGFSQRVISRKLGTSAGSVSDLRDRTIVSIAREFAKAPTGVWKEVLV